MLFCKNLRMLMEVSSFFGGSSLHVAQCSNKWDLLSSQNIKNRDFPDKNGIKTSM